MVTIEREFVLTESGRKIYIDRLVSYAQNMYRGVKVISDLEADFVWGTGDQDTIPIGIINSSIEREDNK